MDDQEASRMERATLLRSRERGGWAMRWLACLPLISTNQFSNGSTDT